MQTKQFLSLNFSELELRNLVEENITQHKKEFTFKGV